MCHHPNYGCEQHFHHGPQHGWHHHWGRCGPGYELRRFPTKEEIVEELEEYLKQLQTEARGVEERITELKKEG